MCPRRTSTSLRVVVTSGEKEKLSKDKEGEEGFNRLFKKKTTCIKYGKMLATVKFVWQLHSHLLQLYISKSLKNFHN